MVDISMEILASSVPLRQGYTPRYRVKTWWAHIDVPPDVTFIKLPRLPMIQPYLIMTGKDTTIFVESWQDCKYNARGSAFNQAIPLHKTEFLGITTCTVDEQLKTPSLNPSVQWQEVYNPVEDICNGKILVKIDAKFALSGNDRNHQGLPQSNDCRRSPCLVDDHSKDHDLPVKMTQSPSRRLNAVTCFDGDSSPITVQSVASRKSDTSVFSIRSVASSRSQEQGVQTDLSLPIVPITSNHHDIVNRLLSKQASMDTTASRNLQVGPSYNNGLPPHPTKPQLDMARRQFTEDYVRRESIFPLINVERKTSASENLQRAAKSQPIRVSPSAQFDKTSLPPQQKAYPVGHSSNSIPVVQGTDRSRKPSRNLARTTAQQQFNNNRKPNSRTVESCEDDSAGDHPSRGQTSESDCNDKLSRFKEVHFDGSIAKQQSANILLSKNLTKVSEPQRPVMMKRRIAAAIFND